MRGQRRILVGIRLGDPAALGTSRASEGLAANSARVKFADRGFRQRFRRHDQMVDADGFDLVVGPRRRRAEGTAGNFLGFIQRMPRRDRFRNVDRQEHRLTAHPRRGRDGLRGDLAVDRTDRHERVDRGVAHHLGGLVDAELHDRDLVGIDAGFLQDDAQQLDIDLGPPDDADSAADEIADALDFRLPSFFDPLRGGAPTAPRRSCAGSPPNRCRRAFPRRRARPRDPPCGLAAPRCSRRDRRSYHGQPYRAVVTGEFLGQRRDQVLVAAAPAGPPQFARWSAAFRSAATHRRSRLNSNSPAASTRNGELSLRRRGGVLAFKPSDLDMGPPSYE